MAENKSYLDEMRAKYFPPSSEKVVEVEQATSYHKYINPDYQLPPPSFKPTQVAKDMVDFNSLFDRVIQAESRGKHTDDSGKLTTSPKGAQGITQIMPDTGKDPGYGIKPLQDDSEAEYKRVGKSLLQAYTKSFGGDTAKGLAAYNWGPGNLKKAIDKHGVNWRDNLPKETSKYLNNILGQ